MTAQRENKDKSRTDRAKVQRHEQGLEPVDCSDIPELDRAWFERAQTTHAGQITMKVNVDRELLAWYMKNWPSYKTMISTVLSNYKQRNLKVVASEEPAKKPVLLVAKFDPAVVSWLKESPDYHVRTNQILRDFMQWCIAQGEPKPE